jgi:cellulose synthase (UDP-forming)
VSARRPPSARDTRESSGPQRPAGTPTGTNRPRHPTPEQLNIEVRKAYADCAAVTGPPITPQRPDQPVRFRRVAGLGTSLMLTLLVLLNLATSLVFIGWLLLPKHVPGALLPDGGWQLVLARISYCVMVLAELIRLMQSVTIWVFAFFAKDPLPMDPPIGLRVALLTTIVPSKEPIDLAERTLRKMKEVIYAGRVDVWILDEGDDPDVKAMAKRIGVHHFTRKGRPEYNQPHGEFRTRSKSGNHNAWRSEHEHRYDVVANVDPDHVPMPGFLERTLGYFRDPDVAFVVTPQVYGNMHENWVAHGASAQQYLFNGVIARGGNGLDAPLLTGTGHLYRPSAWHGIGGYQDSIIEDHLTSIRIHATVNPETGSPWKGVYTPDVVAIGEGPTSWADYFNQQKRWAAGIWEILVRRDLRPPRGLRWRRRWQYRLLQFYYPSVAVSLLLGNAATAVYMFTGVSSIQLDAGLWSLLWSATVASWFILWLWLRRFNIAPHEREEVGMAGMALALFAGPIYLAAGVGALLRRKLAFVVTAKGTLRTTESLRTFRLHLVWAVFAGALLGASFALHHDFPLLRVWAGLTLATGLLPPILAGIMGMAAARRRATAAPVPAALREADPIATSMDVNDRWDDNTGGWVRADSGELIREPAWPARTREPGHVSNASTEILPAIGAHPRVPRPRRPVPADPGTGIRAETGGRQW